MRRTPWALAGFAMLAVIASGCSGGPKSSGVASLATTTTTAVATTGGSASAGETPLAKAVAYARCMRTHGVPNWPDPVRTPHGDYGFRTTGIDPHSAAFHRAGQACNVLAPEGWSTGGQQLSIAQQQAWLSWANCIRSHGVPNFPDPTFPGGGAVQISRAASSSQLQSAMNACRSQLPSAGGLGG
jgi:hypothetical protein